MYGEEADGGWGISVFRGGFLFREREAGRAPHLADTHLFGIGATMSFGFGEQHRCEDNFGAAGGGWGDAGVVCGRCRAALGGVAGYDLP